MRKRFSEVEGNFKTPETGAPFLASWNDQSWHVPALICTTDIIANLARNIMTYFKWQCIGPQKRIDANIDEIRWIKMNRSNSTLLAKKRGERLRD